MLNLLRSADKQQHIAISPEFRSELSRFSKFIPYFNGQVFFNHHQVQGHTILDASLLGLGAYDNNQIHALPIVLDFQCLQ